ncbi:hypothetical protein B9Z55_009123 [Caenorhabditis nigoni]|uniref:Uncharacterized protein n=1 Tax=Caenorhabditis nigoni TaxID=1611254 RepID=A0A2G5UQN4_9PELO|nr:hypothetical protein B9Z55_009123 [Caenorhabditis nigoni]
MKFVELESLNEYFVFTVIAKNTKYLQKRVQTFIAGLTYIPPPETNLPQNSITNREEPASESLQKMLRKAKERAEKLRKRKELSKSAKTTNPVATNAVRLFRESPDEFVGASSFLDNQEYPESKLTFTITNIDSQFKIVRGPKTLPYHKERTFGNVPNVFSLLGNSEKKEVKETVAFKTSLIKELNTKEEWRMTTEDGLQKLKMDDDLNTIDGLEEKEELVEAEKTIIMAEDEDRCTIDEFQEGEEDVTASEEKEKLETEEVKTLETEVERRKENEDAQKANECENQLKEMVVEQELLKKRLEDAKNVIAEKESEMKIFKEKSTKIIANLENQILSYKEVVQTMSDTTKDMEKEKNALSLKLMTVEEERDSDIKGLEEERRVLKGLLEEKARKVDDVEKKMKLKDSEMNQMRLELKELKGQKKQSEDQEKWRQKKNAVIERLKSEAEKFKFEVSKKEEGIVRLKNELSKSTEKNESLVIELSRLKEEMWKNDSFRNELLKKNEE